MTSLAIYFAGDVPDLSAYVQSDLEDVMRGLVGGRDEAFTVFAQADDKNDGARRIVLRYSPVTQGQLLITENAIGEIDSGSPQALREFLSWVNQANEHGQIDLILWGHGTGWKPRNVVDAARIAMNMRLNSRLREPPESGLWAPAPLGGVVEIDEEVRIASLFRHEDPETGKWFGIDATSNTSLDVRLLAAELLNARTAPGGQPIRILGFDACLMASLEVAYELRTECEQLVASVAQEPASGWCYEDWLSSSTVDDALTSCVAAVNAYVDSYTAGGKQYPANKPVTLSVAEMSNLDACIRAIELFATKACSYFAVESSLIVSALASAVRSASAITYQDNIDALTLFEALSRKLSGIQDLGQCASDVVTLLGGSPPGTIVTQYVSYNRYLDANPGKAPQNGGCTVFFPPVTIADMTDQVMAQVRRLKIAAAYPSWLSLNELFRNAP